jgi:ABC-type multidrug transport system fused ATPase/permease subunit
MIARYIISLFRNRLSLVLHYFVTSLGNVACSVLLIVLIQQLLAVAHNKHGRFVAFLASVFGPSNLFAVLAALLVLTQLLGAYLGYQNRLSTQAAGEILELGLMERIIRTLLKLSVQFFKRQSDGELMQAVRIDVTNMRALTMSYVGLVRSGIMAVAMGAVVLWLNPLLAFISMVLLPVIALPLVGYSSKQLRLASRRMRTTGYALFDTILQIIAGIRMIKAYGAEERQADLSVVAGRNYFKVLMDVVRIRSVMQVQLESVGAVSIVGIIAAGGYQITRGIGTWEGLVAFVFASRALFAPLNEIYGAVQDISVYHSSVGRITELLSAKPDVVDSPDARPLLDAPNVISFQDVTFGYGGPPVLHNVNFEIRSGETIGIVGPSGAGKSTLLNLIVRFYDATSGHVRYDGVDVRDLRLDDVYRQTANRGTGSVLVRYHRPGEHSLRPAGRQ